MSTNTHKNSKKHQSNNKTSNSQDRDTLHSLGSLLQISCLPKKISKASIFEYFKNFGRVVSIEVNHPKKNKQSAKGFALIQFHPKVSLESVIAQGPHSIAGRAIKVKKVQSRADVFTHIQKMRECRIYIKDLPAGVDKDILRALFSQFGEVENSYCINYSRTGKDIGYVIFELASSVDRLPLAGVPYKSSLLKWTSFFSNKTGGKEMYRVREDDYLRDITNYMAYSSDHDNQNQASRDNLGENSDMVVEREDSNRSEYKAAREAGRVLRRALGRDLPRFYSVGRRTASGRAGKRMKVGAQKQGFSFIGLPGDGAIKPSMSEDTLNRRAGRNLAKNQQELSGVRIASRGASGAGNGAGSHGLGSMNMDLNQLEPKMGLNHQNQQDEDSSKKKKKFGNIPKFHYSKPTERRYDKFNRKYQHAQRVNLRFKRIEKDGGDMESFEVEAERFERIEARERPGRVDEVGRRFRDAQKSSFTRYIEERDLGCVEEIGHHRAHRDHQRRLHNNFSTSSNDLMDEISLRGNLMPRAHFEDLDASRKLRGVQKYPAWGPPRSNNSRYGPRQSTKPETFQRPLEAENHFQAIRRRRRPQEGLTRHPVYKNRVGMPLKQPKYSQNPQRLREPFYGRERSRGRQTLTRYTEEYLNYGFSSENESEEPYFDQKVDFGYGYHRDEFRANVDTYDDDNSSGSFYEVQRDYRPSQKRQNDPKFYYKGCGGGKRSRQPYGPKKRRNQLRRGYADHCVAYY